MAKRNIRDLELKGKKVLINTRYKDEFEKVLKENQENLLRI